MNRRKFLAPSLIAAALCILFPLCVSASELPSAEEMRRDLRTSFAVPRIPAIKTGSNPIAKEWFALGRNEVAALRAQLRPWEKDSRAKLLTDGGHREHGIRPNTQAMITFATIARWSDDAKERTEMLDDLIAMLRFVAPTHSAGPVTTSDDRKWQNQWQSALWTFYAGAAAWMIWNQIEDDELRWLMANCITREADRFVGMEPPFQIKLDTKAEENAWNSTVVALAANMFPQHPRREVWLETANRWQLSSFLTVDDLRRNPVIDGKTLDQWRLQANIHPDYTMENHDRVHPSYMTAYTLLHVQHLLYTWGGLPSPEALNFNSEPLYEHLKYLSHPDGQMHYPNGQDWELHRYIPMAHAGMNIFFKDPEAALLERISLTVMRNMQARTPDGATLLKQEYFFPSLPHAYAYWYGLIFLFHSIYGDGATPAAQDEFNERLRGVRSFEHGQFVAQRSSAGFASFAWGNRVMGMAIPFKYDLLGTPYELGYVGSMALASEEPAGETRSQRPRIEVPKVEQIEVFHTNTHFTVAATLGRAGGKIEQQIVFISLPEGQILYAEQLTAREAIELAELKTAKIGVLNAPEAVNQDGPRVLRWKAGKAAIDGRKQHPDIETESRWINIDDSWGFIALGDDTWRYEPDHEIRRGRREQLLYLAPPEKSRFEANELIARRTVITTLGQTARETEQLENQLRRDFLAGAGAQTLRLAGWRIEFSFAIEKPSARVLPAR